LNSCWLNGKVVGTLLIIIIIAVIALWESLKAPKGIWVPEYQAEPQYRQGCCPHNRDHLIAGRTAEGMKTQAHEHRGEGAG